MRGGNKANSEADDGLDEASVELDPIVIILNNVNINPNANDEGEWVYNEDTAFEYVLSRSDNTSQTEDVIIKKFNKILALHITIHSNPINQLIGDVTCVMFIK